MLARLKAGAKADTGGFADAIDASPTESDDTRIHSEGERK
jgi:hypothetical protein